MLISDQHGLKCGSYNMGWSASGLRWTAAGVGRRPGIITLMSSLRTASRQEDPHWWATACHCYHDCYCWRKDIDRELYREVYPNSIQSVSSTWWRTFCSYYSCAWKEFFLDPRYFWGVQAWIPELDFHAEVYGGKSWCWSEYSGWSSSETYFYYSLPDWYYCSGPIPWYIWSNWNLCPHQLSGQAFKWVRLCHVEDCCGWKPWR